MKSGKADNGNRIRMASSEGWNLRHSAMPGIKLLEGEKCPRSVQAVFS
jgi:hypothetical protein